MKKEITEEKKDIIDKGDVKDDSFLLLGDWYVNDMKKKDIDKFERAAILQRMIKELGVSEREFSRRYSLHHNTLQDYLLYNEISPKEYETLQASGLSASSIYRHLRNRKGTGVTNPHSEVIVWAKDVRVKARLYQKNNFKYPENTEILLEEAVNQMNNLIVHVRLESKKNRTKSANT